ncbi:glycosyltransferase family 4 protein [Candidatus Contendibacter odensensis]|uniref:Glycosyltransferase n=1 Tax=Candidatus Contendobacter odensis Run_B_J11 TaxID=1400861 RepID=A0A7U7G7R1_9GAMM|nr:glycosyltransferase family 4 protein [Candidatus Contendobacter odensis]CDH43070.1 hypothetical protein BN874_100023 [Candidatus Contendobacter odensis Run_B_J11]
MSKPSLLFVSNVAPDANGYGASIRAWHQISWLSKHYSIDLEIASARISDIERGIPSDLYPLCNRITLTPCFGRSWPIGDVIKSARPKYFSLIAEALWPYAGESIEYDSWVRWKLRERYKAGNYHAVHIFRLPCLRIAQAVVPVLARRPDRIVIDWDDVESCALERRIKQQKLQMGRLVTAVHRITAWRYKKMERYSLEFCDNVTVCSESDRKFVAEIYATRKVAVVPNVMSLPTAPLAPRCIEDEINLLFVGALNYEPNIHGLQYFMGSILPMIRLGTQKRVRLVIVGRSPSKIIQNLVASVALVEIHANVPTLESFYADADIAIVPLLNGGGTRLKILEAFGYGRAVVSTSIGAEGIEAEPGKQLLIGDTADAFAAQCLELIASTERREQLAQAGRQLVVEKYGPQALAAALTAVYG